MIVVMRKLQSTFKTKGQQIKVFLSILILFPSVLGVLSNC